MKYIRKFLVLLVLLMPTFVNAEEKFNVITEDDVSSEVNVVGSNLLAGNNVTSNDVVNGINMLFGNNVNHKANSDYAVVAGNNVNIFGNVNNDGFIFGNLISFDDEFVANRDLFIFGNSVTLNGKINRDVTIYASTVILENVVIEGDATIHSSGLEVKKDVNVNGTLSYLEDINAVIDSDATIANTILLKNTVTEISLKEKVYNFFIDYAGMLVVFLTLALVVPKLFSRFENKFKEVKSFDFISSIGFGALLLMLVPILFVLLLTITIGVPLAILILAIYIMCVWFSIIFTGYLIGLIIWNKFIKKDINILLVGLIGISIISLLQIVPYIGVYVAFISVLLGLGIIFKLCKKD